MDTTGANAAFHAYAFAFFDACARLAKITGDTARQSFCTHRTAQLKRDFQDRFWDPRHIIESVFAVEGEDYCIYLADARESDAPGAGRPIRGDVTLDLPEAAFAVSCYSPLSGQYSPSLQIKGKPDYTLNLPAFEHDLVVRIRKP